MSTLGRFAVAGALLSAVALGAPGAVLAETPPAPPVVTTLPATDVGATRATFHAKVVTNGQPTTVRFQYGGSPTSLTRGVKEVPVGSGPGEIPVDVTVKNLFPGQTFYVVASAKAGDTTVTGDVVELRTTLPIGVDWRFPSADVTHDAATLHVALKLQGVAATVTGDVFEGLLDPLVLVDSRPSIPIGPLTVTTDGDLPLPVSGLKPDTPYFVLLDVVSPIDQVRTVTQFRTSALRAAPRPALSTRSARYGSHVRVTGRLDGAPNQPVALMGQAFPFSGAPTAVPGAVATTSAQGAYAFDVVARETTGYGVTADGFTAVPAVAGLIRLKVFPAVTAQVRRAARHRVVVSGTFRPGVAGTAGLYRQGGDGGRVGPAVPAAGGAFRFPARALRPGRYEVKVVPAAKSGLDAGKSAALVVPKVRRR